MDVHRARNDGREPGILRGGCDLPVDSAPMNTFARAMILAAGRGERMRPLTDSTPKPLLPVRGKPMIVWHLESLARAGVREVVINTAWLEEQFPATLGDGSRWGLRIIWSFEQRDHGGALDTAGGIATALHALAPLGHEPFWVVSGDIYCPGFNFPAQALHRFTSPEANGPLAHLWLVENPPFHPRGDFDLDPSGRIRPPGEAGPHGGPGQQGPLNPTLTYASLALMTPALFESVRPGVRAPLGPVFLRAAAQGRLTGQRWSGVCENVGTPEQLRALQSQP